jgi:Chaperone of endosialidase
MTYIIQNTQGTQIATVNDGQVNNNFDITLIGRNYTNYGQIFNDNLIRMLENFASDAAHKPPKPIGGQMWWRKDDQVLNIWDDVALEWLPVAGGGITLKNGHVGINNKNPKYDLDVTYTFRTKGAAWINVIGDNLETVHNGMVLGALAKNIAPTLPGIGTFSIISNDPDATKLKGNLKLYTDPAQSKRRLAIYAEENNASGVLTLNESGGLVGVGTNNPGKLFDVAGDARALTMYISQNGQNITADATQLKLRSSVLTVESTDGVTPKVIVDAAGNMGIGTTTPGAKLQVAGAAWIGSNSAGAIATITPHPTDSSLGVKIAADWVTGGIFGSLTLGTAQRDRLTITALGDIGINKTNPANKLDIKTANHTSEGLRLSSDGGQWAQMYASLDNAQYNPSVKSGYSAIIYSEGTINTGHFVIAPWGDSASGITLDSAGRLSTNTSSTAAFLGVQRGALRVSDISSTANQWTDLDFGNLVNGDTPLARIGMYYTSAGSYLALGTSNSYATGITNQALTIDPSGFIVLRAGNSTNVTHGFNYNENGGEIDIYDNNGTVQTILDYYNPPGSSSPQSRFVAQQNMAFYINNSTGYITFASTVTEGARMLANGNWGIYSSNPSQKLEVNGGLQLSGSAVLPTATMPGLFSYDYPSLRTFIGDGTGYSYKFSARAASTTKDLVTISDVGDVGIGCAAFNNPGFTTLSIDNPTNGGSITLYKRGEGIGAMSAYAGNFNITAIGANHGLALGVNNTTKLYIDGLGSIMTQNAAGGGMGDGTINAHGLFVDSLPVVTSANIRYPITSAEAWEYAQQPGQSTYYWGTNDGHLMKTYLTSQLNVLSAGTAASADRALFANTAQLANSLGITLNYNINSLGVGCGAPGTTGVIYTTNNIVAYFSDKRLKKDIELIADPLSKVLSLRGVTYTQNQLAEQYGYNNYESQVGVIAQDVQAVLPEAVKLAPFDTDEDGTSKSGENYMTVQYEKIVPLLIEAIKELTAKVAVLEEKLK